MKKAFYFILGIALVILTSATTVSVMTVRPEKPKLTMVEHFKNQTDAKEVSEYIHNMIKSGWQLKEFHGANDGQYHSTWIVVMEKY